LISKRNIFETLLPFKCPKKKCGKSFLQDYISKINKSYKCKETQKCIDKGISFESQHKLNQHLKLHREKLFKCSECEKAGSIGPIG
jgi:hypothetical protein